MIKEFAKGYPRRDTDEFKDVVDFGSDTEMRHGLFIEEVKSHPAKANLKMMASIIDYITEPEESVMDIMAGTGSTMIAALTGHPVILIEMNPLYCEWITRSLNEKFEVIAPGISSIVTLINSTCQQILPLPVNHIIFSPPYSNILAKKSFSAGDISKDIYGTALTEYSQTSDPMQQGNVGNMNRFLYNMEMEKIYKKCYESLDKGGTLTVSIKDNVVDGKRFSISKWVVTCCLEMGFKERETLRWYAKGGQFVSMHRKAGMYTVDEEQLIILEK